MVELIRGYVDVLRKNGVRVATGEFLDALEAVRTIDWLSHVELHAALSTTLIKRAGDQQIFDELFDLYFLRPGDFARAFADGPLAAALAAAGLTPEQIEQLLAMIADEAAQFSPMMRLGMGLSRGQTERLIRLAGQRVDLSRIGSPLQIGYFTQQVMDQLGMREAEESLARLAERARQLDPGSSEAFVEAVRSNLRAMRAAVRTHVQDELTKQAGDQVQQYRRVTLVEKTWNELRPEDIEKLRLEVRRLCQKLRTRVALRPRRGRRGRIDIRKTMRAGVATDGIFARIHFHKKRRDRPQICILVDVSDSVRNVARFMLEFVYTVQELFSKVRTFIFVSDIGETTDLFRDHSIGRAIDLAFSGHVMNVFANSNYGRAFELFRRDHISAVSPKTTVLIIGDGRNNYFPSHASDLGAIRQRARKLYWLNPEPPGSWGYGDSAMREYEVHADKVIVARNLLSLSRVVDELTAV